MPGHIILHASCHAVLHIYPPWSEDPRSDGRLVWAGEKGINDSMDHKRQTAELTLSLDTHETIVGL